MTRASRTIAPQSNTARVRAETGGFELSERTCIMATPSTRAIDPASEVHSVLMANCPNRRQADIQTTPPLPESARSGTDEDPSEPDTNSVTATGSTQLLDPRKPRL